MAASEYDFILTRNQMIESAFRKVGVLCDGETLSAEQLDAGNKALNSILKTWNGDGIMLWTYIQEYLQTSPDLKTYVVPGTNGMNYVDRIYIQETGQTDRYELERLSWPDYETTYDQTDSGKPLCFTQNLKENLIYLWPVPDTSYKLYVNGIRRLKDWSSSSDTGDLDQRWQNAIKYQLAAELSEEYTLPIKERQYLLGRASGEYLRARNGERDLSDDTFVRGAY